ncbi:argininosuccinate lyase [Euzebya sp.]|uniref:argininosuccinate lyase n=1 Tax=Euzebya sp. TaxID=1971409 RepID=UPI003514C92F
MSDASTTPTTPATGEGRLWGGRFAAGPDQAAWALGVSTHFEGRLWPYDLAGSAAHADELRRLDLLTADDHAAITRALTRIRGEFEDGSFAFLPDDEDIHGAIERRLIALAGEAGGRLRAGRSRNDQIVNDLRMYLADAIAAITTDVRAVQTVLADQAELTLDALAPGYTHVQRAQPVTLAHHLLAHAWGLDRDAGRLLDCRRRLLDSSPLASGAMAGLTLPLDPQRYADALGYTGTAPNTMDAVADRDFAVEFLSAAAMLGVHLSRLCEDVVLWASVEFGWARVGDAFSTGSSIMPQKRNPDVAELVRGKTGRLVGDLVGLLVVLKGLPMTYNRDLQEDKELVFDAVDTLALSLPAVTGMIASLTFDTERIAGTAAGGFALATDVAEALVVAGVPFRSAHERVGALVAECERQGIDITDLAPEAFAAAMPELAGETTADLLDPAGAVRRRNAPHGPAPDAVAGQLAALRDRLAAVPRT